MIEYIELKKELDTTIKEMEKMGNNKLALIRLKICITNIQKKLKKIKKSIIESRTFDTEELLDFLKNVLSSYGKNYSLNRAVNKTRDKGDETWYFICDNSDSITKQYIQENIGYEGLTSVPLENAVVIKNQKTTILDNQLELKKIFKENPIISRALSELMDLIEKNKDSRIIDLMNQVIENIEKKENKGSKK